MFGRRFVQSFNRMNLKYAVQPKKGKSCVTEIIGLIKSKFKGQSGIVYCLSRKECDKVGNMAVEIIRLNC